MRTLTTISRSAVAVCAAGLLSIGLATGASAEPNDDNTNHPDFWTAELTELGFVGVECTKIHDEGLDTDTWVSDGDYLLVVLKAGSAQSTDDAENTVFGVDEEGNAEGVLEGEELSTSTGKNISHIITCTADVETETPEPTEPGEPTGPIVETDIVASNGTSPAVLGGAAALAGLGLAGAAAAMRRKGQH